MGSKSIQMLESTNSSDDKRYGKKPAHIGAKVCEDQKRCSECEAVKIPHRKMLAVSFHT